MERSLADVHDHDEVARFHAALLAVDRVEASAVLDSVADGVDVGSVAVALNQVVVPALVAMGDCWEAGDVALSQVYMGGRLCQDLISERIQGNAGVRPGQPRIAVGVLGDSHVLGKLIVVQMLRAAGYETVDWGARLSPDEIVERARSERTEVLLLSVLMLRSALAVDRVRLALLEAGLDVTLVVGGAPFRFDPGLGAEVGANYVGASASDALSILAQIEEGR